MAEIGSSDALYHLAVNGFIARYYDIHLISFLAAPGPAIAPKSTSARSRVENANQEGLSTSFKVETTPVYSKPPYILRLPNGNHKTHKMGEA